MKPRASWVLFGFNALWVVLADQVTKWMAIAHLTNAFKATAVAPAAVTFAEQLDRFLYTLHPNRMLSKKIKKNMGRIL